MQNFRKFGKKPFNIVVVHGGPGAAGEMLPVAQELSKNYGVLEPLQTKDSVEDQIEELKETIEANGDCPAVLIGFSWGAWLSVLVSSRYPSLVKKLILVGSGPFEAEYANSIDETRMKRLSEEERKDIDEIISSMKNCSGDDRNKNLSRLGEIFAKADSFDPFLPLNLSADVRLDIFEKVWPEASEMRKSGRLLVNLGRITIPVTAIHGDYDPHPAAGVSEPFARVLSDYNFILLEKCGHKPWIEKNGRDIFFEILKKEIDISQSEERDV